MGKLKGSKLMKRWFQLLTKDVSSDESKILILYCGGTLGMVRHPTQGYVPYPGFLTETLRTQSRFHDPNGDSIFSWSDTTERYKAWTEAYSRPSSGSTTPNNQAIGSSSLSVKEGTTSLSSTHHNGTANYSPHLQAFCPPIKVLSSSPSATFTKNAVKHSINNKGQLELLLPTMVTPIVTEGGKRRTRYTVLEYDPLLDSSNMETKDWLRLVADIDLNYQSFDAFIILHGTDTMSYTSSAISMLLENLGKPVILTGAQVPLSELRNDAIENVLGALILASTHPIPEVTLFFSSTLYRGNRVSKLSNSSLEAFDSPNFSPLAKAGISIEVNEALVRKPTHLLPFRAHNQMSQQVVLLRLFPGLQVETIENFFKSPIRGVILHSFGAGNAPTRPELLRVFELATKERGIVIVNISQCIRGEVSSIYEVGKKLEKVGVVAGGDMTPESALTKLEYLLGKDELSIEEVRTLMGKSLRGELTERRRPAEADKGAREGGSTKSLLERIVLDHDSNHAIASDESLDTLALDAERALMPYLIQQASQKNDEAALAVHLRRQEYLQADSTSSSTSQSSSRPSNLSIAPLHIASALGYDGVVRRLLESGYIVHTRDYSNHTPLFVAARNGHSSTVTLLRSAGAHLSADEVDLARYHLTRSIGQRDQNQTMQLWADAGVPLE